MPDSTTGVNNRKPRMEIRDGDLDDDVIVSLVPASHATQIKIL